jgi:hypothetical protein
MLKNIISLAIIALCLGLIGCTESNGPINNEPGEPIAITGTLSGGETNLSLPTKISYVLIKSDLILVTEVYERDISEIPFKVHLNITEVLKGSTNANEVQVNTNNFNKGDKCVLFLRKKGDSYAFTTEEADFSNASAIPIPDYYLYRKDDIKLLLNAYNKNKDLFSKAGKQDLFNLWTQFKSNKYDEYIKIRFLQDVKAVADKQDISMLLNWKQRETNQFVIMGIEEIILLINQREE